MVLIEMLMLSEIRARVEFNPRRIRSKSIPHDQVADSSEEISAGNLSLCAVSRISRSNVHVIPKKLCDGYTPFHARGPTTLSKHPCCIRIFEAIDRVAKADGVLPVHVRKFIIA